eukprot:CAMPEP_0198296674 /NCGR_PEP_ID=MMETSP1449-20131203/33430_1 /TAXON_ID=420275 /ORGANISM="Attheya septentrionalis, Strain CCMP2084" /LENGTH=76 /DNA_ID=CAMNT_0043997349 /DNA_START=12 /DNA_END=239 /DNA_ORIENTATION=+
MTPSPPAAGDHPSLSKKTFRFRLAARNAGVFPISDERNNNNNDWQVEPSGKCAATSTTWIRVRDAYYLESIKRKSC